MTDKKNLSSQVKNDLLDIIKSGRYKKGEKLPTETELSHELNISRSTLRAALDELVSEGRIKRVKGSGTYIDRIEKPIDLRLDRIFKLSEAVESTPLTLRTTSIKVESIRADAVLASKLGIDHGEEVIRFERVRSLDEIAAVFSIDLVPKSLFPKNATIEDLGNSLSDFLGVNIVSSRAKIMPVKASGRICEALDIAVNTLCLMLEETTYDIKGTCFDYSKEYYLSHMFCFTACRTRKD
jgi:GntR family transcriptional regulator